MLRFFKVNDPYRLLVLLILLMLVRGFFYWNGVETWLPDLHYLLIGERLASGYSLYTDLWVNIGPLSGVFYALLHFLFGKSVVSLHVIGFVLVVIQAFLFNRLCLTNKVFTENTYLPAVIYALLMSLSMDMFAVSPIMLANTFILLAMNNIFSQIEFRAKRDELILNIGIYLGVASLFYFPSSILALVCILGLMIFSNTVFRRYLLIGYGLLLPFMILATYYFLTNRLTDSWLVFSETWFDAESCQVETSTLLTAIALPVFFLLLSIGRVLQGGRFSSYQGRIVQFMMIWILLSAVVLVKQVNIVGDLLLFVPPFAFFISHYFILFRKKWLAEVYFIAFIAGTIGLSVYLFTQKKYFSPLRIATTNYDAITKNKKIWVIGDQLAIYHQSELSTKYYDYALLKKKVNTASKEYKASLIFEEIKANRPEVIVDTENVIEGVIDIIPILQKKYRKMKAGVYVRIENEELKIKN